MENRSSGRGRPTEQPKNDHSRIRDRSQSESGRTAKPDVTRRLFQDRQRAQSLPPHFRNSDAKVRSSEVQTLEGQNYDQVISEDRAKSIRRHGDIPAHNDGATQTDEQITGKATQTDLVQALIDDLRASRVARLRGEVKASPLLSREKPKDTQVDTGVQTDEPFQASREVQTSEQHTQTRRDRPNPIVQLERDYHASLDARLENYRKTLGDLPDLDDRVSQLKNVMKAQKNRRDAFYTNIQDIIKHMKSSTDPNNDTLKELCNNLQELWNKNRTFWWSVRAMEAYAAGGYTPEKNKQVREEVEIRTADIAESIQSLGNRRDVASLYNVMDAWKAFSEADLQEQAMRRHEKPKL
jgi:hypothetical protein